MRFLPEERFLLLHREQRASSEELEVDFGHPTLFMKSYRLNVIDLTTNDFINIFTYSCTGMGRSEG